MASANSVLSTLQDYSSVLITVSVLATVFVGYFGLFKPRRPNFLQKSVFIIASLIAAATPLVVGGSLLKAPQVSPRDTPSTLASPSAIDIVRETESRLDARVVRITTIGSCPLAQEFVAENKDTSQAREVKAWIGVKCKAPQKAAVTGPAISPAIKLPPDTTKPEPQQAVETDTRIAAIQFQLARVKCYNGPMDGQSSTALKKAINNFGAFARVQATLDDPDTMLTRLEKADGPICP